MQMLEKAYCRYRSIIQLAAQGHADEDQRRLVLEAFLLHARNLRDFFHGTNFRDDILAIDFLKHPPAFNIHWLRQTRARLDKLLAHPSYKRPFMKKQWPVAGIYSELHRAWQRFLSGLTKENVVTRKWFVAEGFGE